MTDAAHVPAHDAFRAMGSVIEVARFPTPPGAAAAALEAMRVFARRYDALLESLNPKGVPPGVFRVRIDDDVDAGRRTLEGRPISVAELLGPGYDIEDDRVQLFHYRGRATVTSILSGLAHALLNPPYSLRRPPDAAWRGRSGKRYAEGERAWMHDVLRAFCRDVLDLPDPLDAEHLRVHEWPTDWSTFFDAGREWWGSFYWTVENLERGWITVLGASSTD